MPLRVDSTPAPFVCIVRGADLRREPLEPQFRVIYDALLAYGVVVVPEQDLTVEQHIAFSRLFGPLLRFNRDPNRPARVSNPYIDDVSNIGPDNAIAAPDSDAQKFKAGNQLWHSDLSFRPIPATASLLLSYEVPPAGGETEFADLFRAYDTLSPSLALAIEDCIAEHSLLHSRAVKGYDNVSADMRAAFPPAQQPLVRVHPETGRKALFVGAHAYRVVGMGDAAGGALLDDLLAHATQPSNVYAHAWQPHDLVIWDNRRMLHRGRPFEAARYRRVMHRTTALGTAETVRDGRIVVGA